MTSWEVFRDALLSVPSAISYTTSGIVSRIRRRTKYGRATVVRYLRLALELGVMTLRGSGREARWSFAQNGRMVLRGTTSLP